MITRLSACLAFSVLLHGVLLFALNPRTQPGTARHGNSWRQLSSRMDVQLAPANRRDKSAEAALEAGKKTVLRPAPVQGQAAAPEAAPLGTGRLPAFSGLASNSPFAPDVQRRMQPGYRQMYEAQARQRARQQADLTVALLQADIEQRINQDGERAEGKCAWHGKEADDTGNYRCEPEALTRLMQADTKSLLALRTALRAQGVVLEGFTVDASGGRNAITYQVHRAETDTAP